MMKQRQKIKYIKPESIDIGKAATVLGGNCSPNGNNPNNIPICDPGGQATGNCEHNGNSAGSVCWSTGGSAAAYVP